MLAHVLGWAVIGGDGEPQGPVRLAELRAQAANRYVGKPSALLWQLWQQVDILREPIRFAALLRHKPDLDPVGNEHLPGERRISTCCQSCHSKALGLPT